MCTQFDETESEADNSKKKKAVEKVKGNKYVLDFIKRKFLPEKRFCS